MVRPKAVDINVERRQMVKGDEQRETAGITNYLQQSPHRTLHYAKHLT